MTRLGADRRKEMPVSNAVEGPAKVRTGSCPLDSAFSSHGDPDRVNSGGVWFRTEK